MTKKCANLLQMSSLKNSPRFIKLFNNYRNIKTWVPLSVCSLSLNLTQYILVQFQIVTELLFSSVSVTSMIKVLTFMQSSIKFMTPWATLHTNQQIPHALVSVSMDSLMMRLLFFPSMIWRPLRVRKWKSENSSRPWLQLFTPLHWR